MSINKIPSCFSPDLILLAVQVALSFSYFMLQRLYCCVNSADIKT